MFHPSPNTAGTHAGISVCTLKSWVNANSRLFLFNKEFTDITLSKRNTDIRHFGNTACGHVIEAMTPQHDNVVV
ncbi:hypothetical protein L9F63_026090 [Diploptera punctata]|uniref:Uncharacterized protein n=1 Tax=Diploptera punctata TaxID=6984 RepID=A0AAD7Z555_DIPPU|nr:hypothetical protein L9F63_026090 [Diploptera punctata]